MDIADKAQEYIDKALDVSIRNTRSEIPLGEAGECDLCGEWSGRLIKGVCAPCRERHGLE